MKAIRSIRFALQLSLLTALFSAAFVAGLPLNAAPVASHGSTGQALALQVSLRALAPLAAHPKTFKDFGIPQDLHRASDGRYIYDKSLLRAGALLKPHAGAATPQVNEAVQTFDVFNPGPVFAGTNLTPTNLTPVWTADETMIVFSSNRTASGTAGTRFHIWAIAINGGPAVQLTDSSAASGENAAIPHGEFFPALSANNNQILAFTSDANSANVQNLYVMPFLPTTVGVSTLTSPTIRGNDANGFPLTGFSNVGRPTFSPNNSDQIVFAATSVIGTNAGHSHIYYLYVSTGGFNPGNPSFPAKLTDGPADDTDPAYSQDGLAIAFASTAAALTQTGVPPSSNPNSAIIATFGIGANRNIFVIGGGGAFGFGSVLNSGNPFTATGSDNFGPAWSSARSNPYLNPSTGNEYLAFARSGSPASPHDIYYLHVLQNAGSGVEQPTAETAGNPVVKLNTDDAANAYDDVYPSWSPFSSVYSIVYQSGAFAPATGAVGNGRTVTYNDPATGFASETAISVSEGSTVNSGNTVGAKYTGILESQVLNLDPPSLLPYSGNELVHVADKSGAATRVGITPGQPVTFTVRLSDREAGVDDSNVYIQIKDPDSKYQDAQGLEHKVFAKDSAYRLQANNPYFNAKSPSASYTIQDSGSSALLMNGGGFLFANQFGGSNGLAETYEGYNRFTDSNGQLFYLDNRGSVAGIEGPSAFLAGTALNSQTAALTDKLIGTISIGRTGGGTNPDTVTDANGKPITDPNTKAPITNPGGDDPDLFIPWGPEYECQVVNPQFAGMGITAPTGDTATTDYRDPYFLAGIDDQQPFSGVKQQSPNGNDRDKNGTFISSLRPTANGLDANGNFAPAEWLQLTRAPQQDGQGGVLYTVNWTTPTSGSDYYLDVIAFDKALAPSSFVTDNGAVGGSNWRIYDNIWGFSTAASIGSNDILVVSDYALGQKFAATTFGGQRGLLNLVPKLYGAESYVTDVDVNILPNAIYRHSVLTGANVNAPSRQVLEMDTEYSPTGFTFGPDGVSFYENGLGVGSYIDNFINDGGVTDGASSVRSQAYSIWRILSRGPVPASVYKLYEPTISTQPAVNDTAGKVNIPAGTAAVANRCIFWLSPFTGDVLAGAGTLSDAGTQNALRAFVQAGGRLCISGQDVGSALTQNGTANNAAGSFLPDVLNASLASPSAGTHEPAPATANTDERLTFSPSYDNNLIGNFEEFTTGRIRVPLSLRDRLIRISNNNGGNVFEATFLPDLRNIANWRTDGSLDQLGPYIQSFTPYSGNTFTLNGNSVVSQIDTITPGTGAHTDLTLAPFNNVIGPIQNANVNASTSPGGVGLIYTESPLNTVGGTGSKVVYATFGLEAVSSEFYRQTTVFKPNPDVYETRNVRQGLIHNIVSYLRTGTITGTVRSTSGNGVGGSGVPGVTVYLQSGLGPAIPGRGTFSATTDSAGNFIINGIEPGSYTLAAYRTGYLRATSNPGVLFVVEGDTTQSASLTITQAPPGIITGTVSDSNNNPVPNASVVFTSSNGQPYSTTTNVNGVYSLSSIPPDTYTGTASQVGFGSDTEPAVLASGATLTVNFSLKPGPGSATGQVTDLSGTAIPNATVYFSTGSSAPLTATTDTNGNYTIASIVAGAYNVTATAAGFGASAPIQVVITGGASTTVPVIQLGPVVNGTLGGLVTGAGSTTPLSGVTLTIVNTGTNQTISPSPVTTGTATTGADGGQINYGPVTLGQGTYTVTATASNGTTAGTQTVTVTGNAFSRVDFTGVNSIPALHTFSAGLNFLSLPFDYTGSTFDSLFGALNTAASGSTPNGNRSHAAVWDPLANQYALDPKAPADAIRLGVGYWIFLKTPVSLTQAGGTPSGSVSVSLHPAWNQIGVPSTSGVLVSSLTFDSGTTTGLKFSDAAGAQFHVVSPTLYRFDGAAYQTVAPTDTLQPYQAYWIKVYVDATVHIPTGR